MADIEKTIEGLRELSKYLFCKYGQVSAPECHEYYDRFMTAQNAMELLTEYKADKTAYRPRAEKAILDYQSWHYVCGYCNKGIDIIDSFCRHCGRPIDVSKVIAERNDNVHI